VGAFRRKATDFTLHVELGGVAGIVAPMIGKQPSRCSSAWVHFDEKRLISHFM